MSTIDVLAAQLITHAQEQKIMLATAESCTGGLIAGALTDVAGSSSAFDRGFVTYSNQAKMEMLGVQAQTLEHYGAVSAQTASMMVSGALNNSQAQLAVSVTGIAGPGGGTEQKPVGLVFIAVQREGKNPRVEKQLFIDEPKTRQNIRNSTVKTALIMLLKEIGADPHI